ncbi:hypothetical protein HYH02_002422 [Chlamydomonas schloesseri]|uniref:Nudix hydrolase domain-containing protein n=1 Tax=Chlamydomonas schloesseri TaxID=2026947 RepID=A0A835WV78_9CHLO|nr:hypothetical protein HYH02_002422 [Chlamydomonas schloesseri]|eukprot:KAG2453090.1 hypothetical protein HYH02_002422 [Chlamydomonas schloesseri]
MPFAYRKEDGELYVLLSLQRTKRKLKPAQAAAEAEAAAAGAAPRALAYTFLGGKIEASDNGDARLTAAREAHEETHGLLHTKQVLAALCGQPHERMVADVAYTPSTSSSSTSSTSNSSSSHSSSSSTGDASSAAAPQAGGSGRPAAADVPAPFEYFPTGRYMLFALHLPDAWRLPEACEAKLQAGERHPEAEKVLGLEWVSLRQLSFIKRGALQRVTLGRGLYAGGSSSSSSSSSSRHGTTHSPVAPPTAPISEVQAGASAAAAASDAAAQPSASSSSSAAAAPEAAAAAAAAAAQQPQPDASSSSSSSSASDTAPATVAAAAGGGGGDAGPAVHVPGGQYPALAHHFLADMLRNKRLSVGIYSWLLCMRRHLRQWHGFRGTRADEAAEEAAALVKANWFSRQQLGEEAAAEEGEDVDSDGELLPPLASASASASASAAAGLGGLEDLFSDLPSSLQVSSRSRQQAAGNNSGSRKAAGHDAHRGRGALAAAELAQAARLGRAETSRLAKEDALRRQEAAKAAGRAAAAAAAAAAAKPAAADSLQAPPPRRPPPPLLPLPEAASPSSALSPPPLTLPPLPPAPLPAALPRPSSSLASAAAPSAPANSTQATTNTGASSTANTNRTTGSARAASYTVWRIDGTPDSRAGEPRAAETRLRMHPPPSSRARDMPSSSPHSTSHSQSIGQGQGQGPAGPPPHWSGHAQGSPAASARNLGGGGGGGGVAEVAVWRLDGEVEWSGSVAPGTTVLKQQQQQSAARTGDTGPRDTAGRSSRPPVNPSAGEQESGRL